MFATGLDVFLALCKRWKALSDEFPETGEGTCTRDAGEVLCRGDIRGHRPSLPPAGSGDDSDSDGDQQDYYVQDILDVRIKARWGVLSSFYTSIMI